MIAWRDLPRKIVIKGNTWKIIYHRGKVIDKKTGAEIWGFCSPARKEIHLSPWHEPADRLDTWCHEVIHAFEAEYSFTVPHDLVNRLAKAMAQFWAENDGALLQSRQRDRKCSPRSRKRR